jgi:tRNA threonylcarbamoyl adenosine modification protein YeaZ
MLLAFDTATPLVTVALHDGEDVVCELVSERPLQHGEQLAPLIDRALRQTGLAREDLTAIGVGVGPGPFTGLRVGLVTARTLGYVLEVPVYGACTLDVLAIEAVDTGAVGNQGDGEFVVATDARRKEVYLAAYDGDGERLEGPMVAKPADVATEVPVVGEGAVLYPDAFPHAAGPTMPSAGWLARVIAEERVELHDPEPLYLRRPDAAMPGTPKRVS